MSRDNENLMVEDCLTDPEYVTHTPETGDRLDPVGQFYSRQVSGSGQTLITRVRVRDFSRRESFEKSADEKDPWLRAVFESSPDGILVETGGKIVFANNSLAQMFGYAETAQLIDIDLTRILSAEDCEHLRKCVEIRLTGDSAPPLFEFKGKRKDGSLIELEASASTAVIDEKTCVIAVIRNLCGHKRAARLINESEKRFQLLGDSILHQIWTADEKGNLEYVNARALEYRGLSLDQALNQVWQEAVHPGDLPLCAERWERSLRTGESYEVEFRLRSGDGNYRWHLGRATALRDENGKITRWFGTNTDINDQKLAEESLRRSEERFKLAARATNDVMWDWDIVTNEVWWNKSIQSSFGYSPDVMSGVEDKIDWWLNRIHPEDKESIKFSINQFLEGSEQVWMGEYRFVRGDNSFAEVIDRRIILRDETGAPLRMVGSLLDITERRQAERALLESEACLRQAQKMEAVGTLTGGVAHDFNNLLTAIIGNTQLALCKLDPDHPLRGRLSEIEKASNRAAGLTRKLLAFSRRQHLEPRTVNLNETISEIMKLLQRIIGEDVEISLKCASDLAPVFADPVQFEQVIMNLCVNARDAMPNGGKLTIETKNVVLDKSFCRKYPYVQPGNYVQVKICDDGIGMDEETQARIFDPFFTTKDVDKGTGLGLSIAYGIIKQHDGYINVNSELGVGTIFKFFLPVYENAAQTERQPVQLPLFGGTETILVAEDEEALRDLAKDVLSKLGYTVLLARNGEEAVEIYAQNPERIDLLLFDIVMPRMGGAEAYRRIRDLGGVDLPLILMTGYSPETMQNRFVRLNNPSLDLGDGLIQKPYNVLELGHKVREVLDNRGKS